MADPFQGGAALGDILFGRADPTAYADQRSVEAKASEALYRAKIARARSLGRDAVTPELLQRVQAGDPVAAAELGAHSLQSGINLSHLGKYQQPHYVDAANAQYEGLGLGTAPYGTAADDEESLYERSLTSQPVGMDVPRANRAAAYLKGGSYQPIRVVGGNMMEDGALLGDDVVPLQQTQATIEQREAAARQKEAQARAAMIRAEAAANASNASADLRHRTDPNRPKGGKPAADASGIARPKSKAEYDKLPSGARFIAPDGSERIKP